MPRLDVLAELQETRPLAPPELRDRVRAIAATATPPRRRITWRRAALVLVPAVLAIAAGAVVLGRGTEQRRVERGPATDRVASPSAAPRGGLQKTFGSGGAAAPHTTLAPAPSATRPQDYDATLRLRVPGPSALSDATKRAVRIATSLGGFASVVDVNVDGKHGDALLRLRVPVDKVQVALRRLSELGTITGESVQVQDVKPQLDSLDRKTAQLQRQLHALRAQPSTPQLQRRIAALTAQIERLQRSRAGTIRRTRLATIRLELATPAPPAPPHHGHGPLHGAVVALTWLGIGALYALIVGGPVLVLLVAGWLAWRGHRRLAERRLLEQR
jgi:hypothetical protein